ncbi:MAG: aquaporin [Thermoplasmata archaeon]|nr:aquaporin [Thermoplasmata archaeon]
MHDSPVARYLAEFLGTFALLLFGGGSAVFSLEAVDPLSRVVLVSLAFGFILLALAYALGDISGGHFNPAVTVAALFARRMPVKDFIPYLIAQVIGGLAGIGVVYGIISGGPTFAVTAAKGAALGSQCFSGYGAPAGCGFAIGSVFLLEAALTFVFILVILRVTSSRSNSSGNLAPAAIGLTLAVTNLVAIPVDGASMNPVRSFSPALLSAMVWPSSDMWALSESWLFWIAPIVGGLLAAMAVRALEEWHTQAPAAPATPTS